MAPPNATPPSAPEWYAAVPSGTRDDGGGGGGSRRAPLLRFPDSPAPAFLARRVARAPRGLGRTAPAAARDVVGAVGVPVGRRAVRGPALVRVVAAPRPPLPSPLRRRFVYPGASLLRGRRSVHERGRPAEHLQTARRGPLRGTRVGAAPFPDAGDPPGAGAPRALQPAPLLALRLLLRGDSLQLSLESVPRGRHLGGGSLLLGDPRRLGRTRGLDAAGEAAALGSTTDQPGGRVRPPGRRSKRRRIRL